MYLPQGKLVAIEFKSWSEGKNTDVEKVKKIAVSQLNKNVSVYKTTDMFFFKVYAAGSWKFNVSQVLVITCNIV